VVVVVVVVVVDEEVCDAGDGRFTRREAITGIQVPGVYVCVMFVCVWTRACLCGCVLYAYVCVCARV
jgi:hypothetical protein